MRNKKNKKKKDSYLRAKDLFLSKLLYSFGGTQRIVKCLLPYIQICQIPCQIQRYTKGATLFVYHIYLYNQLHSLYFRFLYYDVIFSIN